MRESQVRSQASPAAGNELAVGLDARTLAPSTMARAEWSSPSAPSSSSTARCRRRHTRSGSIPGTADVRSARSPETRAEAYATNTRWSARTRSPLTQHDHRACEPHRLANELRAPAEAVLRSPTTRRAPIDATDHPGMIIKPAPPSHLSEGLARGWLTRLRHSALTHAAESDANTATLLALSGHTSVAPLAKFARCLRKRWPAGSRRAIRLPAGSDRPAGSCADADHVLVCHDQAEAAGVRARMIAECMPSATEWVGVIVMSVNPACSRPSRYSLMDRAPAMQPV